MQNRMSISEVLTYSTTRLTLIKNEKVSHATGFIINILVSKDKYIPIIITNRHVVEGSDSTVFEFATKKIDGTPDDSHMCTRMIKNNCWIPHPDPEVDLCYIPLNMVLKESGPESIDSCFILPLDTNMIPTEKQTVELAAMEDVVMIGYPDGVEYEGYNKPIIRKGVTATHPKHDYSGKKETLIDMPCYPGSSGSPVFIVRKDSFIDTNICLSQYQVILMGVLSTGLFMPESKTIESAGMVKLIASESLIPMNLGIVIKSSRIKEIEEIVEKEMNHGKNENAIN